MSLRIYQRFRGSTKSFHDTVEAPLLDYEKSLIFPQIRGSRASETLMHVTTFSLPAASRLS